MGPAQSESEIRKRYVGGHDAAAIVGISPWESPLSVYFRKRGMIPDIPQDPEKAKWGLMLEPVILQGYAQERRVALRAGHRIVDPEREYFAGSPDAFVVENGKDIVGGVDAKSVDPHAAWKWGDPSEGADGVPDHLQVQAQWYLARTKLAWWEIAALFGSSELRVYRIMPDPEVIAWLNGACDRFWNDHVLKGVEPPPDGHDATTRALDRVYSKQKSPPKASDDALNDVAAKLLAAQVALKTAETTVDGYKNILRAFIGDAEAVVGPDWKATWRSQEQTRIDVKGIRAAADAGNEAAQAIIAAFVKPVASRPLVFTHAGKREAKQTT